MQTSWLIKKNHPACILFFAGWGMDPTPFLPLVSQECDVLMVYDYRELFTPHPGDFLPAGYEQMILVAWSMGVWVAGFLLAGCSRLFASAVAVNGTLTPVNSTLGINDRDFSAMITNCTPERLGDFYRSMFDSPADHRLFCRHHPSRTTKGTCLELESLHRSCLRYGTTADLFTHRLVGSRDRIFPARNQIRSWGRERCTLLKTGHFPFYNENTWEGLLKAAGL
jgi:biotin synthesis protein BioG